MNEESTSRYARERLALAISFVLGVGLLYLSSREGIPKFWEKLSEAVGTALMLVVVMDVFFKTLIKTLHSMDHEGQRLGKEWVANSNRWLAESEKLATKEAQEQMARSIKTLLEKVERLDRSLKAPPGS
jgi:hypothetical protein